MTNQQLKQCVKQLNREYFQIHEETGGKISIDDYLRIRKEVTDKHKAKRADILNNIEFDDMPIEKILDDLPSGIPTEEETNNLFSNWGSEEDLESLFKNLPSEEQLLENLANCAPNETELEDLLSSLGSTK